MRIVNYFEKFIKFFIAEFDREIIEYILYLISMSHYFKAWSDNYFLGL